MAKHISFNPQDFEPVRRIALTFPGAEDSISHEGTPSIKVRGKLLCRLHDNGEIIPIHIGFENRDYFLERYPEIFSVPEHFKKYPYIAMSVTGYNSEILKEALTAAWKGLASKKQLSDWESENNS